MARYWSKIAEPILQLYLAPPLEVTPLEFCLDLWYHENTRITAWAIIWRCFRIYLLLRPREQLRSIVMSTPVCVYLSVCPRGYLRNLSRKFYQIFMHVAYGRGSVFLRRRCNTLCTSGFVDNIMFFFYSGPYSGVNFATKDQFRVNVLIYHNIGRNSISYY